MAEPVAKKRKKPTKKVFRWTDEMHSTLIEVLKEYKVSCEFNNVDFDADKTLQYKTLRKKMAKRYESDESLFGPVDISERPRVEFNEEEKQILNAKLKEDQKLIAQGYNRVIEKVKILRQGFSKAVISGTRSGSGKLVYDHYDDLRNIWGGSANTEPLSMGVDTCSFNDCDSNQASNLASTLVDLSDGDELGMFNKCDYPTYCICYLHGY